MTATGNIYVVSAPSGAGKGSILSRTFEEDDTLVHSVSVTTRTPRNGEQQGEHYQFVSEDIFRQWINEKKFAEWAEVHGHLYGTLREELDRHESSGKDVILELDVQGMRSVRAFIPSMIAVFIMPPTLEELERRIVSRGEMSEQDLALRLSNAKREMAAKNEYDHIIVNDILDTAVQEMKTILHQHRKS
jgi:guanylate kinase